MYVRSGPGPVPVAVVRSLVGVLRVMSTANESHGVPTAHVARTPPLEGLFPLFPHSSTPETAVKTPKMSPVFILLSRESTAPVRRTSTSKVITEFQHFRTLHVPPFLSATARTPIKKQPRGKSALRHSCRLRLEAHFAPSTPRKIPSSFTSSPPSSPLPKVPSGSYSISQLLYGRGGGSKPSRAALNAAKVTVEPARRGEWQQRFWHSNSISIPRNTSFYPLHLTKYY